MSFHLVNGIACNTSFMEMRMVQVRLFTIALLLLLGISWVLAAPVNFISKLEGSHKGTRTKDIVQLKQYMEKYGYLHHHYNTDEAGGDVFDDRLEEAVKTFQQFYGLNVTGALDSDTASFMARPRCGDADIRTGARENRHPGHAYSLRVVRHYAHFPGKPKWAKYHLTYEYAPGTPQLFLDVIPRALGRWASLTPFTFSRASSYESADLRIGVFRGDHGDGSPFDGPSGVTAHAGAPYVGIVHFDADEKFSDGVEDDAFHLETIALHEFGHSLGLLHSSDPTAIMFAYTNHGQKKDVQQDDINGLRNLYGIRMSKY
ncbi:hypothetical protein SAY87_006393 [Trapa incisa]|uniref:Peptidase metallopeptidase domain-containing protein n=1 Tax=Trapa incisa TaxID=236973 RepID=A0AAN7JYK8_9MYRT|nr:hypothetical protein SAY87_006393 [Trapa incisa]